MTRRTIEVWLDEDLCSGCGQCVEKAPEVFTHIDGVSRVMEAGRVLQSCDIAIVPVEHTENVLAAAQDCPGEIIMIDFVHLQMRQDA